ncbi:MAG: RimK family protein, partial [bacterium]|nr:RimK family protein [bacterium]
MKGYLIEKYSCMTNAYTCNRLVEEAKKLGIALQIVGVHDTAVGADGVYLQGQKLSKADFVINRYKWGQTVAAVNALADRSYNAYEPFARYINKYEQVRRLHSDRFLIPRFLLATAKYPYEQVIGQLGSPFVAKGLESSMGEQIYLIEKKEQYEQLAYDYSMEKEWLFEEFVQTSIGTDLRYFCIRGQAVAGMIRRSNGDFRANVALGASVEKTVPTEEIQQIAAEIYAQTGLDFVGLDLLFG